MSIASSLPKEWGFFGDGGLLNQPRMTSGTMAWLAIDPSFLV